MPGAWRIWRTGMSVKRYSVERCACGWQDCRTYVIRGIGVFHQGSGFTREEADRIVRLLNEDEERRERQERLASLSEARELLRAATETDGLELPKEDWVTAQVLVDMGLGSLGPARGPGRAWRRFTPRYGRREGEEV